ncbi:peptidoglycan DD-metalloendopeptidase family protein [Marinobacterium jannaschii]|uniref:peptidoglycan DD-metalloendopeptidase family protein n=1 Tax=Marinobacterium jannaschii TaxID=64970 RepID=UPI001FE196BC|nr:peptidoglycan DD-metalloendopeptidase family protein [Marinobacterium jannaschii]
MDERSLGAAGSKVSNTQPVSRIKKTRRKISPVPESYRVKRGDTLYSIAWRYGLDYRQLAARNRISKNYQIFPGQRLRLKAAKPVAKRKVTAASPSRAVKKRKVSAAPAAKKVATVQKVSSAAVKAPVKPVSKAPDLTWRWPSGGRIIAGFRTSGQVNKGLNLEGKKGDPVYASAPGEVVYAGSGLLGYGNLIIINHNQKFLSAYAHNSRIFVKESDMVKGGQKIAEIGRSGTSREMLHFEIRRDGVPVNPLRYLPKR